MKKRNSALVRTLLAALAALALVVALAGCTDLFGTEKKDEITKGGSKGWGLPSNTVWFYQGATGDGSTPYFDDDGFPEFGPAGTFTAVKARIAKMHESVTTGSISYYIVMMTSYTYDPKEDPNAFDFSDIVKGTEDGVQVIIRWLNPEDDNTYTTPYGNEVNHEKLEKAMFCFDGVGKDKPIVIGFSEPDRKYRMNFDIGHMFKKDSNGNYDYGCSAIYAKDSHITIQGAYVVFERCLSEDGMIRLEDSSLVAAGVIDPKAATSSLGSMTTSISLSGPETVTNGHKVPGIYATNSDVKLEASKIEKFNGSGIRFESTSTEGNTLSLFNTKICENTNKGFGAGLDLVGNVKLVLKNTVGGKEYSDGEEDRYTDLKNGQQTALVWNRVEKTTDDSADGYGGAISYRKSTDAGVPAAKDFSIDGNVLIVGNTADVGGAAFYSEIAQDNLFVSELEKTFGTLDTTTPSKSTGLCKRTFTYKDTATSCVTLNTKSGSSSSTADDNFVFSGNL